MFKAISELNILELNQPRKEVISIGYKIWSLLFISSLICFFIAYSSTFWSDSGRYNYKCLTPTRGEMPDTSDLLVSFCNCANAIIEGEDYTIKKKVYNVNYSHGTYTTYNDTTMITYYHPNISTSYIKSVKLPTCVAFDSTKPRGDDVQIYRYIADDAIGIYKTAIFQSIEESFDRKNIYEYNCILDNVCLLQPNYTMASNILDGSSNWIIYAKNSKTKSLEDNFEYGAVQCCGFKKEETIQSFSFYLGIIGGVSGIIFIIFKFFTKSYFIVIEYFLKKDKLKDVENTKDIEISSPYSTNNSQNLILKL